MRFERSVDLIENNSHFMRLFDIKRECFSFIAVLLLCFIIGFAPPLYEESEEERRMAFELMHMKFNRV